MIKNIIFGAIVLAIAATVAYQMDWLSYEGEDVYEDARESVLEKGEELVDESIEKISD